jgi:hypothetical protein
MACLVVGSEVSSELNVFETVNCIVEEGRAAMLRELTTIPNTSAIVKRFEEGRGSDGLALFDTNRNYCSTL